MLFVRKGWLVPREEDRNQSSVVLEYRVLTGEEYSAMLQNSDYAHTAVTTGTLAGSLAALLSVPPHSMLAKGLSFASNDPLTEGGYEFTVAVRHVKMRFLGKLAGLSVKKGLRETVHHATLSPTACHQADLKRLTESMGRKG